MTEDRWTPELLERVRELACALTPLPDMAVLLDVPLAELRVALTDGGHPFTRIYRRTKAEVLLDIRRRQLDLFEAGAPSAADNVAQYVRDMTAADEL